MKAVRAGEGRVALVDVDEPPGAGDEILQIAAAGICCPTHPERVLGATADGGMAEQFRAPTQRLVPLPAGLDVRDASLAEEDAAAMIADNPEIARALITHRFPLEDATEAFRVAADRKAGALRVLVEP